MHRIIALAATIIVAAAALFGAAQAGGQDVPPPTPSATASPSPTPKPRRIVSVPRYRKALKTVYGYRLGGYGGDYRAWGGHQKGKKRLKHLRSFAKGPNTLAIMKKATKKRKQEWRFYRYIDDEITPGGEFSIPFGTVYCESGTSGWYRAVNDNNPDRPAGAYQIITSTWQAHGGSRYASTADAAPPYAQHIVARRIMAGSGSSQWECS